MKRPSQKIFIVRGALLALLCFGAFGMAGAANAEDFFVSPSFDASAREAVMASQRGLNNTLRIFVEDAWWLNLTGSEQAQAQAQIDSLLGEFHNVIYPGLRAYYGEEHRPGVDGDERVYVLFSNLLKEAGGYFREGDQVPRSVSEISNEHEMVYLNADLLLDADRLPSFLAHEFQHLITYNEKNIEQGVRDEVWLNEARSEYSPRVLGYDDAWFDSNLRVRALAFFDDPDESLLEFKGAAHDYGHVRMFAQYLSEQFGDDVMARTMNSGSGIPSVNDAVLKSGGTRAFGEIFKDWAVANYINSWSTNPYWGYRRPELRGLRVVPTQEVFIRPSSQGEVTSVVLDWAARWHRFSAAGATADPFLTVEFVQDAATDVFKVVYVLEKTNGGYDVRDLSLVSGRGTISVNAFGSLYKAVTVIPMSQTVSSFPESTSARAYGYRLLTKRSSGDAFALDAVTPSVVASLGGSRVFVRGTGFTEGARVFVDGVEVTPAVLTGTSVLSFTAPARFVGATDVRVELSDGSIDVLEGALTYIGEGVSSSAPTEKEPALPVVDGIEEGDLIRARGDVDVYIVKYLNGKRFKRLILNPEVFNSYGHFDWNSVKEVDPSVPNTFQTSTIVRAVDDERVFQLFPDGDEGEKRWLNMTAVRFTDSGRDWDSIYIINSFERELYVEGVAVTQ